MSGGQNLLDGKKGISAPEFICGHTRIFARRFILQTHRVVNFHGPQFSSDSTLGTECGRVNQHGAGHSGNRLDSTFVDAILMSRTRSTKVDLLVLLNW